MDAQDLFWLAGLLEGEGSFMKPRPSRPNQPSISISMTDKDIIARVAYLLGVKYQIRKSKQANVKDIYRVDTYGSTARHLMKQLYGYLGQRRREQIQAAIIEPLDSYQISISYEYYLHWLAGLLEGEGSFMKGPPSDPNKHRIQIQMSDKDVIDRVAAIFGTKVSGPYRPSNDKEIWSSRYVARIKGAKAIELMHQLRPFMGERRQAQIDAAITTYIPNNDHGDNHPQAKLTAEKVREIKRLLAAGETLRIIAWEFDVDTSLIWQIKVERIWQHVT